MVAKTPFQVGFWEIGIGPESSLRGLLSYLEEPWDDAVQHALSQEHDIQPTYAAYTGKRRHRGGEQAAIVASRIGAWRHELPLPLKIVFYFWSGKLLKELGYQ